MCGATGRRCKEDERLLNIVLGAGRRGFAILVYRSMTRKMNI